MSELKAKGVDDVYIEYFNTGNHDLAKVYLKTEVDAYIAELKEKHKTEVKELLCLIRDKENNFNQAFYSEEKEIRRHKYKRCCENVWFCKRFVIAYALAASTHRGWKICSFYDDKAELWRKWRKRWLELADKFKEEARC